MDMQAYLADLEYLVNIDSGSEDSEGLHRVADFFSQRFQELGWCVKEYDLAPNPGRCLVCANREAEHYDLMLMGHLDTVFPRGTCAKVPFRIEGDKAFGPGVSDMKNGSLLMYYLMKNLPEEINEKLNILAVFNPDEEVGSNGSRPVYQEHAKKTDYAYIFEGRLPNGDRCVERKGAVGMEVDFIGQAGHCGYVFTNGAKSAISEMARWIMKLDGIQSQERNTTVNIGVAQGGTKPNVVADHAHITVDIRFSDPAEVERVEKTLAELLEEAKCHGIGIDILRKRVKPALVPTQKGWEYIHHVEELAKENQLENRFMPRGGLSDANYLAQCGVICIDGLGPKGDKEHSLDEYMEIDSVMPAYDFANMLIQDLAER